jgi:hypothetical protein
MGANMKEQDEIGAEVQRVARLLASDRVCKRARWTMRGSVVLAILLVVYLTASALRTKSLSADAEPTSDFPVVNCSQTEILNRFSDKRMMASLLRQLSASAEWRVTEDLKTTVAEQRYCYLPAGRKRAPRDSNKQVRVSLRFDSSLGQPGWVTTGHYSLGEPGAKAVALSLWSAR